MRSAAADGRLFLAEFAPAFLVHLHVELLGGGLDPLPRRVAFGVGHVLDLIETRDRVADVARILDRLLALLGEGIFAVVDFIAVGAWPRFNVADSAITIGLVLLFTSALREETVGSGNE